MCTKPMNVTNENVHGIKLETPLPIHLIVSHTWDGGIGFNNKLPWKLQKDLQFFSYITRQVRTDGLTNAVVMGRNTFESLPGKYKPLPGRINVVVSTTMPTRDAAESSSGIVVVPSLQEAIQKLAHTSLYHTVESVYFIGGARIYTEALQTLPIDRIYRTLVTGSDIQCDVYCKELMSFDDFDVISLSRTFSEGKIAYTFAEYRHKNKLTNPKPVVLSPFEQCIQSIVKSNTPFHGKVECFPFLRYRQHPELQYLDLIAQILNEGSETVDRTGVGTFSKPGCLMRFDLKESFPLLTTKTVFWKGVVEELLWFIRGDTNANHLAEKGVKIWEKNASREFLDSRGLHHREDGDLGPVYGFQWRHFGAAYENFHTDYSGKGIDQLMECIHMIKSDPHSRRILMSAWNPCDLSQMALPPCHVLCQFFVTNNELSCMLYQRSADMGLGVPFNIASYALLCRLVAQETGLQPGEFIHAIGHAHVYKNHVEPLKKQLMRCPRPFPVLTIDPDITDISKIQMSHLTLHGYKPYPMIKMEMAV